MQIIVKNDNDFNKISNHPGVVYASKRTGVIDININANDDLFVLVKKYADKNNRDENFKGSKTPGFNTKIKVSSDNNKWIVTFINNIIIKSDNTNLAEYLNAYVKDHLIKVTKDYWWKVFLLIKHGYLEPDAMFKEKFSSLTLDDTINSAFTWKAKVNYRNKKWSFEEFHEKIGIQSGDIKISSCKFLDSETRDRKYYLRQGFMIDISSDSKKVQFRDKDTNEIIELEMKGWQRFRRSNYIENKLLTIACSSEAANQVNPFIVPDFLIKDLSKDKELTREELTETFNNFENEFGYISSRKMPVELSNRLKAEIKIRLLKYEE